MSIVKLIKQSLVYGIGHVLSRFITFLLLPVLTLSLTTNEFGVIAKFYAFMGLGMAFFRYGMDTALLKFYIQKDDSRLYFSSIFALQIASSLFFSLLIFMISRVFQFANFFL